MTWWVLGLVLKLGRKPRGRMGGGREVGVAPHYWLTRCEAKPDLHWSHLCVSLVKIRQNAVYI